MTTSRFWLPVLFLVLMAGTAGAQSQPKSLTWAVAEFQGDGDWTARVPLLLVRGWDNLKTHFLTAGEKTALRDQFLADTIRSVDKQSSQLLLDLDRKRLVGPLPTTEPAATEKTLADLKVRSDAALAGTTDGAAPPDSLNLAPVWSPGRDLLPWTFLNRPDLASRTKALYLVTGQVRSVDGYLSVKAELYSTIENRVLADWSDSFAADEAQERMARASDRFREVLLGRPWAGLAASSPVSGARIRAWGQVHVLPWSSDILEPGSVDLVVEYPGRPAESDTLVLEPGSRQVLTFQPFGSAPDQVLLETDPPGASLYVDSQYIGLSPQSIPRPFATTRVRAQFPGWETANWEIGPDTKSPSSVTLVTPGPHPSVSDTKDRFYWSLAAFSFSLTSTAFLGAWSSEQVTLVNDYYQASEIDGFNKAKDRWNLINNSYGVGIVLTSGLAIWMMVELWDYLGAAQASLP